MKTPVKVALATTAVVAVLLVAALIYVFVNRSQSVSPAADSRSVQVARSDSHVLDEGGQSAVTVVEFLDFECEACGAFYPIVEELREKYAGEITYVVRYFPLPGHFNSKNAAIAAEAAAQQDSFEDMYHRLFQSQADWGEAGESRADLFRGFAEEIGLDMAAYDAAVEDPRTLARVEQDLNEGRALGVNSTPTFFVDGEMLQMQNWTDLEAAIQTSVDQ